MTYITGDIHGNPKRIYDFCMKMSLTENDVIIILGDVGVNFSGNKYDAAAKRILSSLGPTIFCIHGNHEQRPWNVKGYIQKEWNGGKVWVQERYPNLLFASDGEIFNISGTKYLVIGGAYSIDKEWRVKSGDGWWSDEQPSEEIKRYVEKQVKKKSFDVILSHTCPYKYEPIEAFMPEVDRSTIDDSTEKWLDAIENKVNYKAWYCGHWHINKKIDKMRFLYNCFDSFELDAIAD